MTEKDKKRVKEAQLMNPIYWATVDQWANEADTTEAKEELEFIGKIKYRAEEYAAGLL